MNTVTTGTALMLLCGIVGAACSSAASAATSDDDVPSVVIHYYPQSLDTDGGARALYRRIVHAAAEVCPAPAGSSHFINGDVRRCREQSIARAILTVNNPRLAAVYAASSRKS